MSKTRKKKYRPSEERLEKTIYNLLQQRFDFGTGCDVRTFEEAMILSDNHGLVLMFPNRHKDGENYQEFQITIVRSK